MSLAWVHQYLRSHLAPTLETCVKVKIQWTSTQNLGLANEEDQSFNSEELQQQKWRICATATWWMLDLMDKLYDTSLDSVEERQIMFRFRNMEMIV